MSSNILLTKIREYTPTISVGIITADLLDLGSEISVLEKAGVNIVHFDVMDGVFCPAMTFGPPIIKAIKSSLLKDVHLMIDSPLEKVNSYVEADADIITVPAESRHIHRIFQSLGKMGKDCGREPVRGISLNPGTPLDAVEPVLDELEMVLLLAVNPGWGGQKFIPSTQNKILRLKKIIADSGRDILICVDGGITKDNIKDISKMGADLIVTGSAVFDGKAPFENAKLLMEAING